MSYSDTPQNDPSQHSPQFSTPLFKSNNLVTIYTVFRILTAMRRQLGLEAMLEYIERSTSVLEHENPRLKSTVTQALTFMNVEKIYKDTVRTDEKEI